MAEDNPNEVPYLNGLQHPYANLAGIDLRGVDLKGANLKGANLGGANLSKVNLAEAVLTKANLEDANLDESILCCADLCEADFINAHISHADFSGANLRGAILQDAYLARTALNGADLREADLRRANFFNAELIEANLSKANCSYTHFGAACLERADFSNAMLMGADLGLADLNGANLDGTNLRGADMERASLIETKLNRANLDECRVYGISVWDTYLDEHTSQRDLIITPKDQDTITVDDLKVAQFIYLLSNNKEIRKVIDTITSKVVLILGRFSEERKNILNAIRDELRKRDFLPVLFDFDKPDSRDLTETISTLAHMARFVIADITNAKAVPQELQKIVPSLPSLPVQPIILESEDEYGLFQDFGGYLSVLPPYRYLTTENLMDAMQDKILRPVLLKAEEITERRKTFEQEFSK